MAELATADLVRVSPWRDVFKPGTYGNVGGRDGAEPLLIRPIVDLSSIAIIARKGATVPPVSGISVPGVGQCVTNDVLDIASDGPGQWRIRANGQAEGTLCQTVKSAVGTSASVIDQSHGWVSVDISGEAAPDVLAKGTSLDLHLDTFGIGQCAATQIHHMMVHITCLGDAGPTYRLQLFRSMTTTFATWLKDSSAVFGYQVK
jgi:sarcosine oxidase subunit gamma